MRLVSAWQSYSQNTKINRSFRLETSRWTKCRKNRVAEIKWQKSCRKEPVSRIFTRNRNQFHFVNLDFIFLLCPFLFIFLKSCFKLCFHFDTGFLACDHRSRHQQTPKTEVRSTAHISREIFHVKTTTMRLVARSSEPEADRRFRIAQLFHPAVANRRLVTQYCCCVVLHRRYLRHFFHLKIIQRSRLAQHAILICRRLVAHVFYFRDCLQATSRTHLPAGSNLQVTSRTLVHEKGRFIFFFSCF